MKNLFCALVATVFLACSPRADADISDGVVKVGLLLDLNSIYAHFTGQGSVIAARLAIEDAGGRINGKPIELLVADHGNRPERAVAIAREWLSRDKVDVIADVVGSPVALAVQDLNRQRGAPLVMFNAVISSDITGDRCTPTSIHWMYDGYAFSKALGSSLTRRGGNTWFFVTVDNAFGVNAESTLAEAVQANGGRLLGRVRHPLNTPQLFGKLQRAARSGAKVIGLLNAGEDMINSVRQSFDLLRISKGEATLAAVATTINDIHRIGLPLAQRMQVSHSFYWDLDDDTRRWSKRFFERQGEMPSDPQAGVYSSLTHYFKAVQAADSDDPRTVARKMRELPIRDPIVRNARLREDGRMVHDVFLLEVKKPSESAGPWDYLKVLQVIPGEEAFRPLAGSECPLASASGRH